nr:hypothetical protein [Tanacetum cinerariifolium]GEY58577.1 hypothetical protein [Tanacetum cinerariifolium]
MLKSYNDCINKEGEKVQNEEDDLYSDVNINLEKSDAEMTDAQANQDTEDSHVTLTSEPPVAQQKSSFVSSDLVSKFINPSPDTGIVDNYLASKMKEAVDVVVQLQTSKLREEAQVENQEFLNQILNNKIEENKSVNRLDIQNNLYNALVEPYNSDKDIITSYGDVVTLKRGKEAESSKEPTHKESKSTSSSKGASRSQPKSLGKSAYAEEHGQKVNDLEDQTHQEFNTRNDDVTLVREALDDDESQWKLSSFLTPNHEWHKTKTVDNRPPQPWITQMAQAAGTQSSFNEFLATHIDFSAFITHQIKIDNMNQEELTGLTYDLIKGTCKSIVELEYHLEKVFKATNDQLDWHNPEGKLYPHDLSKPIPLLLNERGRQVIPLDQFINNDLEYLKGGSSSKKYITSISKTKVANYGQVKWIEDKVSRIWSPSKQEKQRACVMINAIDKKLMDRRLLRNLEKFVGGRPYEETFGYSKGPYDLSYVVLKSQVKPRT